jgi:hypothetical protein
MKTQPIWRRRLAAVSRFVCGVMGMILLSSMAVTAQRSGGAAAPVRTKLMEKVLQDSPEMRDCLKDQSRGEQQAFATDSEIEAIDLNHDGQMEYQVTGRGTCSCGAQNCSVWIYRKNGDAFNRVLEGNGTESKVARTTHNGFNDVVVTSHDSAATQYRATYIFDGERYREYRNDLVNLATGQVSAAETPVRFKTGTTSTTVKGSSSTGAPERYIIGAREGQTMTINFVGANNGLKLKVYDDNGNVIGDLASPWQARLPSSGKFRILVESDSENPVDYTLKIAVQN